MKIGGLQRFTLIDYPGKVACIVFLSGCNFKCSWCYSSELVLPDKIKKQPEIDQEEFFSFLKKRKGKIDGVVICGGEPTINSDLFDFVKKIKEEGFSVKLDTNGSSPEVLKNLIHSNLLDYIAMDIKGAIKGEEEKRKYSEIVGTSIDIEKIKESIKIIMESGIDYEFRTTVIPDIHKEEDIEKIGEAIKGAKAYYLQNFLPEKTIEEGFINKKPFLKEDINKFKNIASIFVKKCEIR